MGIKATAAVLFCTSFPWGGCLTPSALADPAFPGESPAPESARVACTTLDEMHESLEDDVDAGVGGLRSVISSPYLSGSQQQGDATDKLNMVTHGLTYLRDLNSDNPVPGLDKALDKLERASDDMREAVTALFRVIPGTPGTVGIGRYAGVQGTSASVSTAAPQQGTWSIIDYVDEKKEALDDLVTRQRHTCT